MAGQAKVAFVLLLAMAAIAFGHHHHHHHHHHPHNHHHHHHHRCPSGWSAFNGRCFKYHNIKLDWSSAEKHCLSHGAHLISIHSEEDYQHAKSVIRAHDPGENPTWIGLSRSARLSNWNWSDRTPLTFTKWNAGEPNALPIQLCVHMNFLHAVNNNRNWNEIPCNLNFPFVCVKRRH